MVTAIAHRGDPEGQRENTLAAFDAAVRQGADMVELDLRRTADGSIVVLHDETLERLWGVPARVDELTVTEVRAVTDGDDRIPTLAEALRHVELPVMVDFTGPEVVEGALLEVRQADAVERCLFVTDHVDALRQLRSAAPEVRIGLTWLGHQPPPPALTDELDASYWNPWFPLLDPASVDELHERGLAVSTWTVDEVADIEAVLALGVDAVVTNRIGRLRSMLDSTRPDE
ncbi:MAG TPA: glycerophosphodiester phosphodiesterase [Acidimicrobiales bacterium]|nr:glycerophosphodiester phosphodiesterase [Acidimicrobiales bacterium]